MRVKAASRIDQPAANPNRHGVRLLMLALLRDALRLLDHDPNDEEVLGWLEGPDIAYVFCFHNVCEVLQLDPHAVRARIWAWRATVHAQPRVNVPPLRYEMVAHDL